MQPTPSSSTIRAECIQGSARPRPGPIVKASRRDQHRDADDDQLAAQLGSLKCTVDSPGRITIESKDDMRKRGMPSPDRADALMMAWTNSATAAVDVESHGGGSITGDVLDAKW